MNKYFTGVKTVDELRQRYKELLKQYHPDNGGDLHIMQEINAEYEVVFAILKQQTTESSKSTKQASEEDIALRAVLNEIISLDIDIEIIGSWIWCFNCYTYKDKLKTIGFKYAPKKQAWTWHFGKYSRYHSGEVSIDDIRAKYGSQRVYHSNSIQYHLN